MRNILKAATLESKFPLLAVESDCIVSKDADITVAFEVELPELFTVTSAEYAAIHAAWCKAVKVLPDYTVVHKQDWFVKEHYRSRTEGEKLGFLSRSYELHFNERPFLNHCCYLYLTKTTKERGGTFFRCRRAVRPHCKRHGTGQTAPSVGRRGNRHGGTVRPAGEIPLPVAGGHRHAGGHRTGRRRGAHRRQTAVGLHALGTGRAAGPGRYGQPL